MWVNIFRLHQYLIMKKYYSICKKNICIEANNFPGDNLMWEQFETETDSFDIEINCKVIDPFPGMPGKCSETAGDFIVSVDGDTVYREFPMGTVNGALTRYTPADTSYSETFFTKKSFPVMMDSRYMWNSISLAQLLLPQNAFFIHSSYISVGGKAILFSAPCGTGKSTQAALWEKYRNAEVINGDKAGILVENGVHACGVPFCGTSGICKSQNLPLGAIVFLSQSPQNHAEKLCGTDALQKIMQNIYLDFLAPNEKLKFVDLAIEIISSVPIYAFGCTPDEDAVITLEKTLKSEGVI